MNKRTIALGVLLAPTAVLSIWALDVARRQEVDPSLRIAVSGYDPRDLLRGHYINFTLRLTGTQGADCVCLTPDPDAATTGAAPVPRAVPASCEPPPSRAECPYYLHQPQRAFRYYASQERALELERELARNPGGASATAHFDGKGDVYFSGVQTGR